MRRLIMAAAVALLLLPASSAQAEFGFNQTALAISGTQAGAHPAEVSTFLEMNSIVSEGLEFPDGHLKDLEVDMPPGFAGNPTAVPQCTSGQFFEDACPNATAVGVAAVKAEFEPFKVGEPAYFHAPVYSMVAEPGFAAQLGFFVVGIPVTVDVGVRESPPYNVYAQATNASEVALLYGAKLSLWGNPASSVHDPYRGKCLEWLETSGIDEPISKGNCTTGVAKRPFLTSPRSCEGPLVASFEGTAWNSGEVTEATAAAPARTGCANLGFAATTQSQLSTAEADSPSGLSFDLNIDDEGINDPSETATAFSDIKRAEVILPEGVTLNPSQGEGLAACSEEQLGEETASSAFGDGCPAASKVGSVEAQTPLLEGKTIKGSLFIAEPHQNPFGSLFALYMVIKDPQLGVSVKLPARIETDPVTGQVKTTFGDPSADDPVLRTLPQLPLSHVHVSLKTGERSPLVSPPACGTYATKAVFTPWANPASTYATDSSFTITSGPGGSPCPTPGSALFSPGFSAGTFSNSAGSFSPLAMRLTRSDSEQELTRFSATLPQGLVPKLAGVAECGDGAIAAAAGRSGAEELLLPSCPASSRVGRIVAGAGAGPALTYVKGSVYLAGPFAGHPLSVVAIVPAVAGPFDLGTVVTREAIDLNPTTYLGEIDGTASDPIPRILQGVPLRLRDLQIYADRPEFTMNPTSCAEKQVLGNAVGESAQANLSHRYQAANCAALGFKPKLTLKLKGATKRTGHPALRSTLLPRAGDANIGAATVLLPPSLFIDQAHISNPCTRVQFNADACPPKSVLGTARAYTPLLDQPLEGPVYFRSNGGERELPDVVADLHGQFRIILVGFVDSRHERIRTRFLGVPDAPVSRFELNLFGGKRGLLQNNRNLCAGKKPRTKLTLLGQNGRRQETTPVLGTSCKHKKKP